MPHIPDLLRTLAAFPLGLTATELNQLLPGLGVDDIAATLQSAASEGKLLLSRYGKDIRYRLPTRATAAAEMLSAQLSPSRPGAAADEPALFETVLEQLPIGVWITDAEGRILYGNRAARSIWSDFMFQEEGHPQQYRAWWPDSNRQVLPEEWGSVKARRHGEVTTNQVFEIETFGGERKRLSHSSAPIHDSTGAIIGAVGVLEDVTERDRAAQELRASEERFVAFMNAIPAPAWIKDSAGRHLFINRASEEAYHLTRDDWYRKTSFEMATPEIAERIHSRDNEVLATGEPQLMSYLRVELPDGIAWWNTIRFGFRSGTGEPMIGGFAIDVTKEKQAADLARETALRLELAASAGNVGLWDWNLATGEVFYSPEWKRQLGYEPTEIADDLEEWRSRLHPEDAEQALERIASYKSRPGFSYEGEFRLRHRDGHYRWILSRAGAVLDETGEPVRLLGSHIDITERKQAEEAREQLEEQLRQAQKMRALGTLAGGIAHDFNNILGAIIGNVELALQDAGSQPGLHESLQEIRRSSLRARDLVRRILTFSRQAPPELSPIDIADVVNESARLLRATLPAGVHLAVSVDPSPARVMADRVQLEQVLLNLGANAWQSLAGGAGRIEIATRSANVERELEHAGLGPGRYVVVSVRDDGGGMDPATLEQIFNPFFTTRSAEGGTGLGLSVVDGILKTHRGAIRVHSERGAGSVFEVYLPMLQPASPASTVSSPVSGRGQQILYLDDEEALVFVTKRLLARRGYEVHGFTRAEDAIAAFEAEPTAFDLFVTDLNMPGVSGLDVAARFLRRRPDLPVALASGYVTDELRQQAEAIGIGAVIYKPNMVKELADSIQQLLDRAGKPG